MKDSDYKAKIEALDLKLKRWHKKFLLASTKVRKYSEKRNNLSLQWNMAKKKELEAMAKAGRSVNFEELGGAK